MRECESAGLRGVVGALEAVTGPEAAARSTRLESSLQGHAKEAPLTWIEVPAVTILSAREISNKIITGCTVPTSGRVALEAASSSDTSQAEAAMAASERAASSSLSGQIAASQVAKKYAVAARILC